MLQENITLLGSLQLQSLQYKRVETEQDVTWMHCWKQAGTVWHCQERMGEDLCRIRETFVNSCLRELRFVQTLRVVQPGAYFIILWKHLRCIRFADLHEKQKTTVQTLLKYDQNHKMQYPNCTSYKFLIRVQCVSNHQFNEEMPKRADRVIHIIMIFYFDWEKMKMKIAKMYIPTYHESYCSCSIC